MTWTQVTGQSVALNNSSSATPTIAFTNTVGSNNLIVGGATFDSTATLSSVKDDKNNTYTLSAAITDTPNLVAQRCFWCTNITNAPKTITLNFTGSPSNACATMAEWSGGLASTANDTDGTTGQYQATITTTANSQTSGSVTTTVDGDLIVGFLTDTGNTTAPTAGTSPTLFTSLITASASINFTSIRLEYATQTTHGSIAATGTAAANGDSGLATVVTFKPASGGGTVALTAKGETQVSGQAGIVAKVYLFAKGGTQSQVFASPTGKVGLSTKVAAQVKSKAVIGFGGVMALFAAAAFIAKTKLGNPSAKLTLSAHGEAMGSASASPAGRIGLASRTILQIKEQASATGRVLISATAESLAKAFASPVGKLGISARATSMTKTLAGIGTGGLAALRALASVMAKATVGTPKLPASLFAKTEAQTKVSASPAGNARISTRAVAQVKSLFATPKLTAAISARFTAQSKAVASPAGKVGLTATVTAQVKSKAFIAFSGIVALLATITSIAKAQLGNPSARLTLSAHGEAMGSASASSAGRVGLSSRAILQVKEQASATGRAALSVISTAVVKASLATPKLLAVLSTHAVAMVKGAAFVAFSPVVALFATLTAAAKARFGSPSARLPLASRIELMGTGSASMTQGIGLTGRTVLQLKLKTSTTYKAALSAIGTAAVKGSLSAYTGKLGLTARTALQVTGRGIVGGFNIPIALFGRLFSLLTGRGRAATSLAPSANIVYARTIVGTPQTRTIVGGSSTRTIVG